jgi:hypothetical protein
MKFEDQFSQWFDAQTVVVARDGVVISASPGTRSTARSRHLRLRFSPRLRTI